MWMTIAMLPEKPGGPKEAALRCALRSHAFNFRGRSHIPDGARKALAWVKQHSRPVADLAEPTVERALAKRLSTKVDGSTRAVWSQKRNHAVVKTMLDRAVEQGLLTTNPVKGNKRTP